MIFKKNVIRNRVMKVIKEKIEKLENDYNIKIEMIDTNLKNDIINLEETAEIEKTRLENSIAEELLSKIL